MQTVPSAIYPIEVGAFLHDETIGAKRLVDWPHRRTVAVREE